MLVEGEVFDAMASNACRALTGYPALLLAYLWNTYSNAFPEGPRGAPSWKGDRWGKKYTKQLVYFYLFFVYIHMYPTNAQMSHTLRVAGQDNGISHTTFYTLVMPIGHALANAVAEINYDDRLDPMNHHPFFPVGVTQIFDTFPIYVATPSDWRVRKFSASNLKLACGIPRSHCVRNPRDDPYFFRWPACCFSPSTRRASSRCRSAFRSRALSRTSAVSTSALRRIRLFSRTRGTRTTCSTGSMLPASELESLAWSVAMVLIFFDTLLSLSET